MMNIMDSKETNLEKINYLIEETPEGESYISKKDSPNIHIFVKKGLTVIPSQLKKYKERTIFIDGVFNGSPFVNNEKLQYSLDHHEGVIRNFTLSSCEQALIMVLKGLTFEDSNWEMYINEPDLDSILTLWILCNYKELHDEKDLILQKVVRLTRVEGLIDVHGFSMADFLGYQSSVYETQKIIIEKLLEQEKKLKESGEWAEINFTKYTLLMLGKIDIVIYGQDRMKKSGTIVTELYKLTMLNSKYIVICESKEGIYEVEEILKERYKSKLGLIILKSGYDPKKYTLRLSNDFITPNLNKLYKVLNRLDPIVTIWDKSNRWGGSDNIGGSPRKTGTDLTPADIKTICSKIYCKLSFWDRLFKKK